MTQATSNTLIAIASIDVKLPSRLSRRKPRRAFPTDHAEAA